MRDATTCSKHTAVCATAWHNAAWHMPPASADPAEHGFNAVMSGHQSMRHLVAHIRTLCWPWSIPGASRLLPLETLMSLTVMLKMRPWKTMLCPRSMSISQNKCRRIADATQSAHELMSFGHRIMIGYFLQSGAELLSSVLFRGMHAGFCMHNKEQACSGICSRPVCSLLRS